jgi:hypothetical protein
MRTRWKASSQESSGWTPWQPFPTVGVPNGFTLGPALAAAQLPAAAEGVPAAGRLQVWANGPSALQSESGLYTTRKSTEAPSSPWEPWTSFTAPPPTNFGAVTQELEAVPLVDGRVQLWAELNQVPVGTALGIQLWSTVMAASSPESWSAWQQFDLADAAPVMLNITAAPLPTGETAAWALGAPSLSEVYPALVYMSLRQGVPGNPNEPLSQWGPWSLFEVPADNSDAPPTVLPPAQGLLAAADGHGRAYLWVNADIQAQKNDWMYTYSTPSGSSPLEWSPLISFPTPASQGVAGNGHMTAAPLPEGGLQVLYLTAPAKEVWTCWQQAGQSPTTWTQWSSFQ